jgi:hypothetical protein
MFNELNIYMQLKHDVTFEMKKALEYKYIDMYS